jgi:cytochrome b6-f complex iron-sulfur subunit
MDQSGKQKPDEQEISRRDFFAKLGIGSLGLATVGTLSFAYQYMSPNVLYEPSPIVNAGNVDEYSVNSVTMHAAEAIYVVRLPEGIFSLTMICTHLGCMTAWKPELGIIACPCHGSRFSEEGQKLAGPAPRPLPWLRTWLSDDRDVMVDRSTDVPPFQFLRI